MTTIELYQPRHIDLKVSIPTSWNELTGHELVLIAEKLIGVYVHSHESKLHILVGLINSRLVAQKKSITKKWFAKINRQDASIAVTDVLAWIFTGISLTQQCLPVVRAGLLKRAYFGPTDSFNDLTCGEFEDCEIFFFKFKQQKQFEDLVMLTAILWRRHHSHRPAYAGYNAEIYKAKLSKLPAGLLYANYLWYTGCRNKLAGLFPLFFGGGSAKAEPDIVAFTKCIHAGAGPENGTRDVIRKTLLKEFAMDMEMRIQRNNDLEKTIKK